MEKTPSRGPDTAIESERVGKAFAKMSWDWMQKVLGGTATPRVQSIVEKASVDYAHNHPIRGQNRLQWAAAGILALSTALAGCDENDVPEVRPDVAVAHSVRMRTSAEAASEPRMMVGTESRQTQIENQLIVEAMQTYDREVRRTIVRMLSDRRLELFLEEMENARTVEDSHVILEATANQVRARTITDMHYPTSVHNPEVLIQRIDESGSENGGGAYTLLAAKVALQQIDADHRAGRDRRPGYLEGYADAINQLPGGLDYRQP